MAFPSFQVVFPPQAIWAPLLVASGFPDRSRSQLVSIHGRKKKMHASNQHDGDVTRKNNLMIWFREWSLQTSCFKA
jgi:hypothetical protein